MNEDDLLVLENNWVKLEINLQNGTTSIFNSITSKYFIKSMTATATIKRINSRLNEEGYDDRLKFLSFENNYKRNFEVDTLQDEIGKGKRVIIKQTNDKFQVVLTSEITIYEDNPSLVFQISISNNSEDIKVIELFPFSFTNINNNNFNFGSIEDWRIFKIGYQSWSNSRIMTPFDRDELPNISW
ncbi:MAG: hypothetical protein ACFFG0_52525, partial [Candidatus Thorarchaeota archaeon]